MADQAIGANSTEPTRAHPRNWLPVAGPGAIRGLLSDINTNVLRRGDIFWLEELNDPQKVYFTRTAGTYTTEADLTDPDNVIELTDGAAAVSAHNTSGTAHNDIRSDVSTVEDRLDALDGVEIEPYDSTATYSRGSANSIVTHSSGLFVYISSTERSSGHDPDTQPGYWLKLSEGVAYEVITSGSAPDRGPHRHRGRQQRQRLPLHHHADDPARPDPHRGAGSVHRRDVHPPERGGLRWWRLHAAAGHYCPRQRAR